MDQRNEHVTDDKPTGELATFVPRADPEWHRSIHIAFASTSGHTEYVVERLIESCNGIAPGWEMAATMAEKTHPADWPRADVLLLASGTWNVRGFEGELNPHMQVLLDGKAADVELARKPCACIALGDDRYFYTAKAADHLERYVRSHHGSSLLPTLRIVNDPYGQEAIVRAWATQLMNAANRIVGR